MVHDARAIARHFLVEARKRGIDLNPMQLLKLVYIAHGWSLAITDEPLIKNRIEAWDYGPVIPDLYHEVKQFGRGSISSYDHLPFILIESELFPLINQVIDAYGSLKAFELSALTHKLGTPWNKIKENWNNGLGKRLVRNPLIPNDEIKKHFLELWEARGGQKAQS